MQTSKSYQVMNQALTRYSHITNKKQLVVNHGGYGPVVDPARSYSSNYTYGYEQPHAPSVITDSRESANLRISNYSYDLSGNQTGYILDNLTRTLSWDAENRLRRVQDVISSPGLSPVNLVDESYWYNDSGLRVKRDDGISRSVYVNQFFSERSDSLTPGSAVKTKIIYAGNEKVASVVRIPNESGDHKYFYASDHLGSTGYLTDGSGNIVEHIEYTPWGESWLDNSNEAELPNYKYTGKELDSNTNLYYYGARYYDPKTSVWINTDPIFLETAGMSSGGRLLDDMNLSLYAFCNQNPVLYFDPDGNDGYLSIFSITYTQPEGLLQSLGVHSFLLYVPTGGFSLIGNNDRGYTTFSTWGRSDSGGWSYWEHTKGLKYDSPSENEWVNYYYQQIDLPGYKISVRTKYINDAGEQRLGDYLFNYDIFKGDNGWYLLSPCSEFSEEGWEVATGEILNSRNFFMISSPATLSTSINYQNLVSPTSFYGPSSYRPSIGSYFNDACSDFYTDTYSWTLDCYYDLFSGN